MAQTLGIEAESQTLYQMRRYRLRAKLKVARPQNNQQDPQRREAFQKNSELTTWSC